jgi:hypothetical protein
MRIIFLLAKFTLQKEHQNQQQQQKKNDSKKTFKTCSFCFYFNRIFISLYATQFFVLYFNDLTDCLEVIPTNINVAL